MRQSEQQNRVSLDVIDTNILRVLSQDARISIVNLAERIRQPLHIVHYRLKELKRKKIIEAFKPKIAVGKLGYQWHLLLLQLAPVGMLQKQKFMDFCKSHPAVYYVTNTIGDYNVMLDVHVRSTEEFRGVLSTFKKEFADSIRTYESIIIFDEYKIDYFHILSFMIKIRCKRNTRVFIRKGLRILEIVSL